MLRGGVLNRDETCCGIDLIEPMHGIRGTGRRALGDVVHSHGYQGFDPRKRKVMSWANLAKIFVTHMAC
jgi:hypothetical protein